MEASWVDLQHLSTQKAGKGQDEQFLLDEHYIRQVSLECRLNTGGNWNNVFRWITGLSNWDREPISTFSIICASCASLHQEWDIYH
jgi:hypothetical protein